VEARQSTTATQLRLAHQRPDPIVRSVLEEPVGSEQERGTGVQLRLEWDGARGSTAQERLAELLGGQVGRRVVHQPRAAVADACADDPGSDDAGEHDRALTASGRERSVRALEQ